MEIRKIREAILRYSLVVIVLAIAGLALAAYWRSTHVSYVSSASVLVQPTGEAERQLLVVQPDRYVRTQIKVIKSEPVLSKAVKEAAPGSTVGELAGTLSLTGGDSDNTIDIVVTSADESYASTFPVAVAEAYFATYPGRGRLLEQGGTTRTEPGLRSVAAGLLGGGAAGVLLALLLVQFDRRVSAPKEAVLRMEGVRFLPFPVAIPKRRKGSTVIGPDIERLAHSLCAERALPLTVVVAGVDDAKAARQLSSGLGAAYASLGTRVALLSSAPSGSVNYVEPPEATVQRDGPASHESLPPQPGAELQYRGLWLQRTLLGPDSGTVLRAGAGPEVLTKLRAEFDVVIVEVPPALESSSVNRFGGHADRVLIVAEAGRTREARLRQALDFLSGSGDDPTVVLVRRS